MIKKKLARLLVIALALPICALCGAQARGALVMIGGALKSDNNEVFSRMIELGGGRNSCQVAIIAAASATPAGTGNSYKKDFIRYGVAAGHIHILPLALLDDPKTPSVNESLWKKNAFSPALVNRIEESSIVFLAGGDQRRYSQLLLTDSGSDTPLLSALRRLYSRGGVIAGTSAGTAVMSDPMITGGDSLTALTSGEGAPAGENTLSMNRGFGLFSQGIVDQHFLRRGRLGRLVVALLSSSLHSMAVGVDEDTAAVIQAEKLTVAGRSAVVVLLRENTTVRSLRPLYCENLTLHFLQAGDIMDLKNGVIKPSPLRRKNSISHPRRKPDRPVPVIGAFEPHGIRTLLIRNLAQGEFHDSRAIALFSDSGKTSKGVQIVARRTRESQIFSSRAQGGRTWTLVKVKLDIFPVQVNVRRMEMKNK